jgi:hypothetical protein
MDLHDELMGKSELYRARHNKVARVEAEAARLGRYTLVVHGSILTNPRVTAVAAASQCTMKFLHMSPIARSFTCRFIARN